MVVTLTGFMGCGKSSVGRALSTLLCLPFIDLDRQIEQQQGCSIAQIFETGGEKAFRAAELECLRKAVESDGCVIALGGGTVMTPEAADIVFGKTVSIYLSISPEIIRKRVEHSHTVRPLFDGMTFQQLYDSRRPVYERASATISTDNMSPYDAAGLIKRYLEGL